MIAADFQVTGTQGTIAAMRSVLGSVSGAENRLKIARAAVPYIQDAARAVTPIFKGPTGEHYLYDTPKLLKKLRAPNGKGRIKTIYRAGNTAVSIQDLSERRTKIAKAGVAVVGPLIRRSKAKGPLGTTEGNADAWYAHMIYGSAKAFGNKVMQKALTAAGTTSLNAMERIALRMMEAEATKQGLK